MGFAALVLLLSHLFESPSAASPVEAGPPGLDPARAVKDAHAKHSSAERKADHAPFQCTEAARMLNKCN
jgi:hypothetical protein